MCSINGDLSTLRFQIYLEIHEILWIFKISKDLGKTSKTRFKRVKNVSEYLEVLRRNI